MSKKIWILNGPNLNLLGSREPEVYGHETLADIESRCTLHAKKLSIELDFRQSNVEGELVTWIQQSGKEAVGLILNAGAYTHTSIALMDALLTLSIPVVEVHLSNIYKREDFRHHSYISKAAKGVICGFGSTGYILALDALASLLEGK